MNNPEFELLVYLITSARALPEEPASYGSIRLIEAASRLCQIICNNDPDNKTYCELLRQGLPDPPGADRLGSVR